MGGGRRPAPHSHPLSLCTRLMVQSDSGAQKKKKWQVWTAFPLLRNTVKTSEKAGSNPAISATEARRLQEAGRQEALLLRWGKGQLHSLFPECKRCVARTLLDKRWIPSRHSHSSLPTPRHSLLDTGHETSISRCQTWTLSDAGLRFYCWNSPCQCLTMAVGSPAPLLSRFSPPLPGI